MPSEATFHGWSRLPDELQIRILTCDLDIDCDLGAFDHNHHFEEHIMPLISTRNRHLADLALEIYYDINQFMIYVDNESKLSHFPPAVLAQRIRNLRIYAEPCDIPTPTETLYEPSNTFKWIVRPPEIELPSYTHWQLKFSGLRYLSIDFAIGGGGEPGHCCVGMSALDRLKKLLDESATDLRAAKVHLGFDASTVCVWHRRHEEVLEGLKRKITARGRVPRSVYRW